MDIMETYGEFVANTYARFPICLIGGKGAELFDENGKLYIDLGSGIAVNTFGATDEKWQQAVTDQAKRLQHASNLYYTGPSGELARMLCEKTGMKKVFFSNSGAEANECAIKAARRYSFLKYGEGRHTIITLKNSFHGRTITTLAATGQETFHTVFGPFTEGFKFAEPNDPSSLRSLTESGDCAAIMMEMIQGEGGIYNLSREFVEEAKRISDKKDILLIIDEVQTGNGRTGKLYSYMHYGFMPDIVTTAKGLGGGLPIGATLLGEKLKDTLIPGSHGSTFGGNPICCAGALSILSRLDSKLMEEVTHKSEYIISELIGSKGVKSISGMGLMLGIECERPVKDIIAGCIEKGVLVLSAKEKVRLLPPLTISYDELKKAVAILKEEIAV